MTITANETVLRPIIPAAGPAAGGCAPGDVALFAAPIQVGTPVRLQRRGVRGRRRRAVRLRHARARTGIQNGHDTAGPGELVIYDRELLRVAVAAGTAPPERRVTVGKQPRSVASLVRPDYERVFVVNYHQDSYSVTVLNRKTWALVAETKTRPDADRRRGARRPRSRLRHRRLPRHPGPGRPHRRRAARRAHRHRPGTHRCRGRRGHPTRCSSRTARSTRSRRSTSW